MKVNERDETFLSPLSSLLSPLKKYHHEQLNQKPKPPVHMEKLPRTDTDSASQRTLRENTTVPARLRQGGWC